MIWYAWLMVAVIALNILANAYEAGKGEKKGVAVIVTMSLDLLLIWGIVELATR